MIEYSIFKKICHFLKGEKIYGRIVITSFGPEGLCFRKVDTERKFIMHVEYHNSMTIVKTSRILEIRSRTNWVEIKWDECCLPKEKVEEAIITYFKAHQTTGKGFSVRFI
jgi:hypothetical protein